MAPADERLAAMNLARRVGRPPSGSALLVCSASKRGFAVKIAEALADEGVSTFTLELPGGRPPSQSEPLRRLIHELPATWGLGFLMAPRDAGFMFDVVGRPDTGMKIDSKHFFCDWCMSLPGFIRTNSADRREVEHYKAVLLASLVTVASGGTTVVEVTSPGGTNISLLPRNWIVDEGEILTSPLEGHASGTVLVDGCVYSGPPKKPFALRLERRCVVNLHELDRSDDQQRMAFADLTKDPNAAILAEFALGVNPEADAGADLMESEQARGTCHFGFGRNVQYGGTNESGVHVDFVVQRPTVKVGGVTVVEGGLLRPAPNV